MEYTLQENVIVNEEINNEKYNVEVMRNNLKALKDELKRTNEDINHIRHFILTQMKDNELLKKQIVKQVIIQMIFYSQIFFHNKLIILTQILKEISNQRYVQEVEILTEHTREFTNKFKSQTQAKEN